MLDLTKKIECPNCDSKKVTVKQFGPTKVRYYCIDCLFSWMEKSNKYGK